MAINTQRKPEYKGAVKDGITTFGELKNLIKSLANKQLIDKIKSGALQGAALAAEVGGDVVANTLTGFGDVLGGMNLIKTATSFAGIITNFAKAFDDEAKTKTFLDKLNIDDEMSKIVDDRVENSFIKQLISDLEKKPDNEKLPVNFNINAELINYLKTNFKGRTLHTDVDTMNNQSQNESLTEIALKILNKNRKKQTPYVDNSPVASAHNASMGITMEEKKSRYKMLKRYDSTKHMNEGSDGYPYVIQTDDEIIDDDKFNHTKSFMDFAVGKLGITSPVKVTMTNDRNRYGLKTLAHYSNADSHCVVASKGRSIPDIMRSIAHELVHKRQFEKGKIKGPVKDIGGPIENEANAVAGQLIKEFGYKNPQIFE